MKFKGEPYRKDIQELIRLKAFDEKKYLKLRDQTSTKYGVSVKTIYRDMSKEKKGGHAGLRKTRSDAGKFKTEVTQKEKVMVTELMKAGKTKKEAVNIASQKTGQHISTRKADRIKPDKTSNKKFTMFAPEAKKFIEGFFEFDLIAPDAGIPFKYKGLKFTLVKEDLSDIIMVIINAFNRVADQSGKLQLDRMKLLKSQIFNQLAYQTSVQKVSSNLKDLETITRMYARMEIDYGNLSPDLKVVTQICRTLKPDITEDEIFSMIEQFSTPHD